MYYSGRRSKQRIQGQRIIFEGKGPNGWNNNILLLHFPYWPEIQKSANLIYQQVFCWTVISHQSFSPFPSTSVEALGLFTFLPQSTVHNLRISELGFFYIVPWLGKSIFSSLSFLELLYMRFKHKHIIFLFYSIGIIWVKDFKYIL